MTVPVESPLAAHIVLAERILSEVGGEEAFDAAILSGSVAAGLGHANSDLDVHVVCRVGFERTRRGFDAGDRKVQLTYLEPEQLRRYVSLLEEYVVTGEDRAQSRLPSDDLWHVMRLAIGRVIWASPESQEVLSRIDQDVARQVVMSNFASPLARASETTTGMLERGQYLAACHSSVRAMLAACELALAATGDLYVVDRFLGARIERSSALRHVASSIWSDLHVLPPYGADVDDLSRAARDRIFRANALASYSLVYGWATALDAVPEFSMKHSGPSRSLSFTLLRFADSFALAGPMRSLRVGEIVAALWVALDGSELPEVTQRLEARGHPVSLDQVTAAVSGLMRAGAVRSSGGVST